MFDLTSDTLDTQLRYLRYSA